MAKRESDVVETQESKMKRRRLFVEEHLTKKYTICVSTLDGREITLNDVLGYWCLSHVRRQALQELRQLPGPYGDDFKGRSAWEYDIVHTKSIVLPSCRKDFKCRKHYVYEYLNTEDRICLIRNRRSGDEGLDAPEA